MWLSKLSIFSDPLARMLRTMSLIPSSRNVGAIGGLDSMGKRLKVVGVPHQMRLNGFVFAPLKRNLGENPSCANCPIHVHFLHNSIGPVRARSMGIETEDCIG